MTLESFPHLDKITINVKTKFLAEQSEPSEDRYVFSYTITITNTSEHQVQLKSRSWLITDANGDTTTVEGEGVVGQQPFIASGESFTYTSGCILKTPLGAMQGYYLFNNYDQQTMKTSIEAFRLAQPNILH